MQAIRRPQGAEVGSTIRHERNDAGLGHQTFPLGDPGRVISMATHDGLHGGGERFVGELLGLLHSSDPTIRAAAATALGIIGDERAIGSLRAASEDLDSTVAAAAALARSRLGDESAPHEACARLSSQLREGDAEQRALAARALGALGLHDGYGPLVDALKDQEPTVREDAAEALGRLGDSHATEALAEVGFGDPVDGVRGAALGALARLVATTH
jgi:HEAT repeat protein